jgi:hypothetical protein
VPPGALHVHAANAGETVLHVRQTVRPDPPNPQLVDGVERFFETMFALAQRGKVLSNGLIVNPLQSAMTERSPLGVASEPDRFVTIA